MRVRGRLKPVEVVKQTLKEVNEDHVMAFAGNLTYRIFFALFPFFVFLLSLLGIFGAENLVNTLIRNLSGVMPASATQLIKTQLLSIARSRASGAFTFGAIVSVLLALWGVSGAFRSVMEAMNVMYEVEENRPFWKVYGISIFISLAVIVLLVVSLGIVVFGASVGGGLAGVVGLSGVFRTVWAVIQWPILAGFVLFAFALVYYYAPAVTQRWRWISPGAVVALLFWVGFSLLFSVYVSTFGSYNATYGSFAGIIILLLYIYYSTVILLVGAELNQVIEERIPEGKDEGEREPTDELRSEADNPKEEKI